MPLLPLLVQRTNFHPPTIWVFLKRKGNSDIHEFMMGDQWYRITVPSHFTHKQAACILSGYILAGRRGQPYLLPEDTTISPRSSFARRSCHV